MSSPSNIRVRSYREVVGESPPVTPRDIEKQELPQSFEAQCKDYFGRAVRYIKNDTAPTLQSITPPDVLEAISKRFWMAPTLAFGLAVFGDYPSWLLNATSGGFAEVMDRAKVSSHDSANATDASASLLALHMLKGSYRIVQCVRDPSIQNCLGAMFDIAATIKYVSIITKLTSVKTD